MDCRSWPGGAFSSGILEWTQTLTTSLTTGPELQQVVQLQGVAFALPWPTKVGGPWWLLHIAWWQPAVQVSGHQVHCSKTSTTLDWGPKVFWGVHMNQHWEIFLPGLKWHWIHSFTEFSAMEMVIRELSDTNVYINNLLCYTYSHEKI